MKVCQMHLTTDSTRTASNSSKECRGWDAEALTPIVEFMGKKPIPVETIADNSIVNRLERYGFIDKLYGKH